MKNRLYILAIVVLFSFGLSSCYSVRVKRRPQHKEKRIPPGQAKKMVGSKSAKPFAPGQQKRW